MYRLYYTLSMLIRYRDIHESIDSEFLIFYLKSEGKKVFVARHKKYENVQFFFNTKSGIEVKKVKIDFLDMLKKKNNVFYDEVLGDIYSSKEEALMSYIKGGGLNKLKNDICRALYDEYCKRISKGV